MKVCYKAGAVTAKENYYSIAADAVEIRLWFLTDEILRIRAGFDGDWDEASYSLVMTAWDSRTDELMKDYRRRVETAKAQLTDGADKAVIQGEKLRVEVEKDPFRICVYDAEGTQIHADIPFNIGNIIAGSRFLRIQFDQFIFGHGVEADYLIVRRNCHVKISGLLFKTKLVLCLDESNRNVAAAEFMRQIVHILFITKHFLALEDNGAHPIRSIQLLQKKIYIILSHVGFIPGTQYHIEPMRS